MSQFSVPTLASPPARRGTPSTNGPIPFFNGQGVATAGGSNALHSAASVQSAYQTTTAGLTNYPQQQPRWPPTQYGAPPSQYQQQQQQQTYGQIRPLDVPPRCATGPAVEYPYQSYGYEYSKASMVAPSLDSYRSASVVYSGTQYGTSFGYQASSSVNLVPADGATFFDQLASTVEPSLAPEGRLTLDASNATGSTSGYYASQYPEQPVQLPENAAVVATNSTTTEGATQSGVIYDQGVGQYYDTNSGQYYDDSTGAWYYPQIASTNIANAYTHSTAIVSEATTDHSAAQEPVGGTDGAAFFDHLNATVVEDSYPAAPHAHNVPDNDYMLGPDTPVGPSRQEPVEQTAHMSRSSPGAISALAPNSHPLPGHEVLLHTADQLESEQAASTNPLSVQSVQPTIDTINTGLVPARDYWTDSNVEATTGIVAEVSPSAAATAAAANQAFYGVVDKSSQLAVGDVGSAGALVGTTEQMVASEAATSSAHGNNIIPAATSVTTTGAAVFETSTHDPSAPSQFYTDHYTLSDGMYSSEPGSQAQHGVQSLLDMSLSSQPLESDFLAANATGEHSVSQEFDYSGSGATSETMGRSVAAVSRTLLPTPSLSTNWSLQAEHDSASSIIDTTVGAHMSDTLTTSATEDSHANDLRVADPYTATYGEPSSVYYGQQYGDHHQLSAAAIANVATSEVIYESFEAHNTQESRSAVGTEFVAEYLAYDGATVYGETFESDGALATDASPQFQAQFQPLAAHSAYADNGYASYDPYAGTHPPGTGDAAHSEYDPRAYHPNNEPRAEVQYDTTTSAAYGVPTVAAGDLNQGSYRTVSSLSGPALPLPPALLDFQAHSERTSTDISFYDHNAPSVAVADAGMHDPLGRLSACRPVVSFGFGGRLVTMFPRQVQRFNMYDSGKASKVAAGMLQVSQLADHMRGDHFVHSTPLLTGETSRAALLKRRDVAVACARTWMSSPLQIGSPSQDERALCNVLIAVLGAFNSSDASQFESSAVLGALQPLIVKSTRTVSDEGLSDKAPPISHGSNEQLDLLEALLLQGKRTEAIDMACRQNLWTHALIIASCTGKQHWQSVVSAYTSSILQGGHSTLGIQYRMFSGLGADALGESPSSHDCEFVTAADIGGSAGVQVNQHNESLGGAFAESQPDANSGDHAAADWAKILSLMLANRTPGDQGAILKLGDRLRGNGQALAAHICYALTLQSKDIFLPESPEALPRAILLGTAEMSCSRTNGSPFEMAHTRYTRFYHSSSAIFLTELYEVAFALKAAANGDAQLGGTFAGVTAGASATATGSGAGSANGSRPTMLLCLPHLQAYKLYHAWWLVDCGQAAQASRYCDSVLGILATLPQGVPVPYIHASLVQELRNLRDRLSGSGMTPIKAAEIVGDDAAVSSAGSKSWLARAMPRPSFTSLMSAFDSSIDKFITGADGNRISLESSAAPGKYEVGPDRIPLQLGHEPEQHIGSARPLGAANWEGRTPSPRILAANMTNGVSEASRYPDAFGSPRQSLDGRPSGLGTRDGSVSGRGSVPPRMYTPSNNAQMVDQMARDYSQLTAQPVSQPQWGDPGSSGAYSVNHNEYAVPRDSFGDGSRLSASSMSYGGETAGSSTAPPAQSELALADDDEEDMFGFSRKQPSAKKGQGSGRPSADTARSTAVDSSREKTTSGKGDTPTETKGGNGVLGILKSFWGGRKNQANLGEESNFVYDPVQKRWVDKNASAEQQDVGPPPPPPPSAMRFQPQSSSVPPPASANVHQHGMPGVAYRPAATTGSSPLGADGGMGGGRSHLEMVSPERERASRYGLHDATPPVAASADLSRTASPASSISAMGAVGAPPVSAGGRGGKRRAARTKYVDLLNQ
ncbi:hypothetical protein GGI20_002264 [Coemansia sp. BCRC 34301]|nr:hypothetical protein GGI20_002264 [Coemansia sp. BCRC 34301]